MTPRLKQRYEEVLKKELTDTFGYKNAMQVPRLDKIVINMAVGKAGEAIEPERLTHGFTIGRLCRFAEHHIDRVAGDQCQQEKDQRADPEQDERGIQQLIEQRSQRRQSATSWMLTGQPLSMRSNSAMTSVLRIRIQPCDAGNPIGSPSGQP